MKEKIIKNCDNDFQKNIRDFRSLAAKRRINEVEVIWNNNQKLRDWVSGRQVDFGTDKKPDFKQIPLQESIINFKSALKSRYSDIIKAIWDGDEKLRAWFIGQLTNFGTSEKPDFKRASLEELITNFKSVLASRKMYVIRAIWNKNEALRLWLQGQVINFGTEGESDFQQASLVGSIANFKTVLASHSKEIIKAMWRNPQLSAWFCGQPTNFGTEKKPDFKQASLVESITNFKAVLSSQSCNIMKTMLKENILLSKWLNGRLVNFGTQNKPRFKQVLLDEYINYFQSALSSKDKNIIQMLWNGNKQLQAYYSSKPANFNTAEKPDFKQISTEECINNFKSVLSSQRGYVVKKIWNINKIIRAWFKGEMVNFGTEKVPDLKQISLAENIASFKAILQAGCNDVVNELWEENEQIRKWFTGQSVNVGTETKPNFKQASFEECINNFKISLFGQHVNIIKEIINC